MGLIFGGEMTYPAPILRNVYTEKQLEYDNGGIVYCTCSS